MTGIAHHACTAPCGTRARYVSGCRCSDCKGANRDYYHRRQAAKRERLTDVKPTGPPIVGTLARRGRDVRVLRCPGANGASCVRTPATWLRGQTVCQWCVERVTVWNGNVDARLVREHLMRLRRAGVGYKSVAVACDVPASVLARVLAGGLNVRASTAKRVLAVDDGAQADGAIAPRAASRRMLRLLAKLVDEGFRKYELAALLGSHSALQVGRSGRALLASVGAVDRLWRRYERGEVAPRGRS